MAEQFLTLEQACEELQMSADQVRALASAGQLETTDVEGQTRFLRSSVVDYKQRVEGNETVVYEGKGAKDAHPEDETDYEAPQGQLEEDETDLADETEEKTGKLDLSDIDEEPGADESDQTSVLQPVSEDKGEEEEGEPVFEFEEEAAPSFFTEEGKEGAGGAQAKERETISLSPEDLEMDEVELTSSDEPSHTEMVADILKEEAGKGEEDESLETIDLAELEAADEESGSVMAEEGTGETQRLDDIAAAGRGDTETVSLEEVGARDETGTVLDVTAERLEEEEEGEVIPTLTAPSAAARMAPAAGGEYVMVQPSALANVALAISGLLLAFGGFLAVCGGMGFSQNFIAKNVYSLFVK